MEREAKREREHEMRRNGAEDVLSAGRGREVCRARWGCVLLWREEMGGVGEGKQRERGYSCRTITIAEVQTSREFERQPVAVRASTTVCREIRSCAGLT